MDLFPDLAHSQYSQYSQSILPDSLLFLSHLAELDGSTIEGVSQIQTVFGQRLKTLGFKIELVSHPQSKSGPLLIAELGEGPTVNLICHADTVVSSREGVFEIDWSRQVATGPGLIDNKGGLVIILKGLELFLQQQIGPNFRLRVVCSPNEEVGSPGFHDTFSKLESTSFLSLGFEPSMLGGNIITKRRGNRWYSLLIKGKEAHCGRSADGLNAAHDLCIKMNKLLQEVRFIKGASLNIGSIHSIRDCFNIVCGQLTANLDSRFEDVEQVEQLDLLLKTICLDSSRGTQSALTIEDDCPPFATSLFAHSWLARYLEILSILEREPRDSEFSGGASDLNYICRNLGHGFDGLGPIGKHMHTEKEELFIPSLETRAQALASFLDSIQETML